MKCLDITGNAIAQRFGCPTKLDDRGLFLDANAEAATSLEQVWTLD
jgi:hypothetical protein